MCRYLSTNELIYDRMNTLYNIMIKAKEASEKTDRNLKERERKKERNFVSAVIIFQKKANTPDIQ